VREKDERRDSCKNVEMLLLYSVEGDERVSGTRE
jgi:hypothetical protein